jgi:methionyl-tRNA formyltransferase
LSFRSLFFGTPAFAVPSLEALHAISEVVGVVCQPDKPSGRGMSMAAPPVKLRAHELGLSVVQPTKLKTGEFAAWVRAQNADLALVTAYGRILPKDVLAGPRLGMVNVHASLLPKYRGAAPITWAIVNGETETGITLMVLDEGMDTGPMLEAFPLAIGEEETAGELSERLAKLGGEAVTRGLPRYVAGGYTPTPQDPSKATVAPLLKKEDGVIDFRAGGHKVHDHVRGMNPWPGAHTTLRGKLLKVHEARVATATRAGSKPGEVLLADKSRVLVACVEGSIELVTVQLEGKKAMRAPELVMGRAIAQGDVLGAKDGGGAPPP